MKIFPVYKELTNVVVEEAKYKFGGHWFYGSFTNFDHLASGEKREINNNISFSKAEFGPSTVSKEESIVIFHVKGSPRYHSGRLEKPDTCVMIDKATYFDQYYVE